MIPHISVAIPAFNEGKRLPPFIADLARTAIEERNTAVEFIVCDDGSQAEAAEAERAAVEAAQAELDRAGVAHRFRFVRAEKNGGKGAAIRLGWSEAAADADWLAFLDADGAVSAREFFRLARTLESADAEAVAASRIKMAGKTIDRDFFRHLQGRVFATMAEWTFRLGFYDTQCGLKFFRASALRPILPRLRETHWLLDLEVLAYLKRGGAKFVEVPIDWVDQADSRVRFGVDAVRMFRGLQRIKRNVEAAG